MKKAWAVLALGLCVTLASWAGDPAGEPSDPVHRALIARLEQVRRDLKSPRLGVSSGRVPEIDEKLSEAIAFIRDGDAYFASHQGSAFKKSPPPGALGEDPALGKVPSDLSERLRQVRENLKAYKPGKWGGQIGKAQKALDQAISKVLNATAKPTVALQPTTATQPWPSVDFGHFMSDSRDLAHRQLLWTYFLNAERAAHAFATSSDRWVPLKSVQVVIGQNIPGEWSSKGVITLKGDDGPGTMFHEIFHTAFHRSRFHGTGDGRWTEAWCDAFRYAAEKEFIQPPLSKWVKSIDRLTEKTYEQASAHGASGWLKHYGYPASVIVKRSGGTMSGLLALWEKLNQQQAQQGGGPVFDRYFGFTAKGKGE